MATTEPPRPRAPIAPQTPQPSLLDPIGWLQAAVSAAINAHYGVSSWVTSFVRPFAVQLAFSFTVLWTTLWLGLEALRQLVVTTGQALSYYWERVIQPLARSILVALREAASVVRETVGPVAEVLEYLGTSWLARLVTWGGQLGAALLALPQLLRGGRNVVLVAVDQLVQALFGAETRAHGAFGFVVDRYNLAAAWLNHLAHPAGVVREDPFVWSAQVYFGDVQAVLINSMVELEPPGLAEALRARFPLRTFPEVLARWVQGTSAQDPAVTAALARFRAGAGA